MAGKKKTLDDLVSGKVPDDPIAMLLRKDPVVLEQILRMIERNIEDRRHQQLPGRDLPREGKAVDPSQLMMDLGLWDVPGPVGTRP